MPSWTWSSTGRPRRAGTLDWPTPSATTWPTGRAFLLGFWEGEPVAAISVVRYDDHFAFLGFYIVKPEMRGRGLGWKIWTAGLAHAGARTIGLDGVVAQQENYRKSGFELAHRNIRYGGRVAVEPPDGGPAWST